MRNIEIRTHVLNFLNDLTLWEIGRSLSDDRRFAGRRYVADDGLLKANEEYDTCT